MLLDNDIKECVHNQRSSDFAFITLAMKVAGYPADLFPLDPKFVQNTDRYTNESTCTFIGFSLFILRCLVRMLSCSSLSSLFKTLTAFTFPFLVELFREYAARGVISDETFQITLLGLYLTIGVIITDEEKPCSVLFIISDCRAGYVFSDALRLFMHHTGVDPSRASSLFRLVPALSHSFLMYAVIGCIVTDQGQAIPAAFCELAEEIPHFLCMRHLSAAIKTHLKTKNKVSYIL